MTKRYLSDDLVKISVTQEEIDKIKEEIDNFIEWSNTVDTKALTICKYIYNGRIQPDQDIIISARLCWTLETLTKDKI